MGMTTSRSGGHSIEQFESEVHEMFKCSICTDVLKDPVELSCQHLYCKSCILQVLSENPRCPQCRVEVQTRKTNGIEEWIYFRPKRYLVNMLCDLRLKCDFDGCQHISTIEAYENHQYSCQFNPNGQFRCPRCKAEMLRVELKDHDCVNYLLGKIRDNETTSAEHIATLEEALLTNTNVLEKQIRKQSLRIAQLENQNKSRAAGVSELQSLPSEDTILVSINCVRDTINLVERTMIASESDTIRNVCDQFINELGDGDKFCSVISFDLKCYLDLNKTVKDYGINDGYKLLFC